MKAPILNLDVQLMLQTKQVKLSQGLNSTPLQLQTWPILVKESKLFCKNLKHSDSVIKMMMNKIAFTTFSITEYGTICMIKGNPGTLEAQLLFAFCKSATVPELFKTKLPKETLHIQGLSLP